MDKNCRAFRDEWLRGERTDAAHAGLCAECAGWMASTERVLGALAGLGRLSAPAELAQRVERELGGDRSRRVERVLNSLVRRGTPAVLDERVAASFGVERVPVDESRTLEAQALRALDVQPAPEVLERLLDEELRAPERQRVERFSGSLERLRAPAALAERLGSSVRRRALVRLVVGPLATLAAAGLVVWIAVRRGEPERRTHRFDVIEASSLEGIDPMARMLAESLGGGATRRGDGR